MGNPILGRDACTEATAKYWSKKFEEVEIDAVAADNFVRNNSRPLPEIDWRVCFFNFISMMTHLKQSAAGPDGMPYRAWSCSSVGIVLIYSACILWLHSGQLPTFFNVSYLWILPKTDPSDGVHDCKNTRPLSGANSDAKIFALFLASFFNTVLDNWAISFQRGFISGRQMLLNSIEVELCCEVCLEQC